MDFTSSELNALYELTRSEANRIRRDLGWTTEFEEGSWAQRIIDLDRKLTADYRYRCPI